VPKHNTKHGGEVIRPIPNKALPFIQMLFQLSKTDILFPPVKSSSKSDYVSRQSFTKLTDFLNEYIGIPEFDTHDLRRTFSTKLSELNTEPYVVEMMLGHKLGGVFETYNKHSFIEQKRIAIDKWVDRLELLAQDNDNVVLLSSAVG
jgi:integrase